MRFSAALLLGSLGLAFAAKGGEPVISGDWRAAYRTPAPIEYPEDNPYTADKASLGGMLFFDPILSGNRTRACVSCHLPERAWGDGLAHSVGDRQLPMALRSPTLFDVGQVPTLGWDGKFPDIETVTFAAITGSANMNLSRQEALDRLSANPGYVRRFAAVFGPGPITAANVERAIATYQRGIVSGVAPFDRWVAGDETAVSDDAKRGMALFTGKAGCSGCHSGWSFTDFSFQDIGSATGDDIGRGALFPSSVSLRYAFKVPTLRSVALRAPYMHNGSLSTLADVIELYDRGGIERPSRSLKIRRLGLTDAERSDLIAFLQTLTGDATATITPIPGH